MIMIFRSQAWFRNVVSAAIVCAGICGCALPQLAQQKGRPKPSQEKFSCGESIPKSKLSPAEFEAATRTSTPLPAANGGAAYQNVQTDWTPRAADGSSQPH
ncbi:MAG: hypothetical protein U0872_04405 [Planctomycetaceae bacterium]